MRRRVAQRLHGRVRHRDRAHHAVVAVAVEHEQRRADHVTSGLRAPRKAVDFSLDRAAQQPVPRRVEFDLVDPVAEPVVRAQDRRVALGSARMLARLDASRRRPRLPGALGAPLAALAGQRFPQRQVDLEQVDGL